MHTSDFDFALPPELIAQAPLPRRDGSRLLHLTPQGLEDRRFEALPQLLRQGDLLVVKNSRVLPARLLGHKKQTRGRAELLLVRPEGDVRPEAALGEASHGVRWVCLGQSSKGFRVGMGLCFEAGLEATVDEDLGRALTWCASPRPSSPSRRPWIARAGCPSPPTFNARPRARIWTATRPSMRRIQARWPRPPRVCTSRPRCWKHWSSAASSGSR